QHRSGQDSCGWIRNTLASDIWCRAVYWLKHRRVSTGGVNIARRRQADAACYCTCQVGQNVAKEVVGDDDVIARRVGNHVNGCSVDVVVVDFNLREFRCYLINGALPQVTSVDQHIGLVYQGQLLTAVLRAVESITHNALNTVT